MPVKDDSVLWLKLDHVATLSVSVKCFTVLYTNLSNVSRYVRVRTLRLD
jgi:hypothetical protein